MKENKTVRVLRHMDVDVKHPADPSRLTVEASVNERSNTVDIVFAACANEDNFCRKTGRSICTSRRPKPWRQIEITSATTDLDRKVLHEIIDRSTDDILDTLRQKKRKYWERKGYKGSQIDMLEGNFNAVGV